MGKVSKATKRFSKNHLSNEIKTRKLRQKVKFREKKVWGARKSPEELEAEKQAKAAKAENDEDSADDDEPADSPDEYQGNVDAFLEKGFFEALEDEEEPEDQDAADDEDDDEVDPIKHKQDLERLKVEQPEFYKYLAENDSDLLAFGEGDEDTENQEESEEPAADGADEAADDESKVWPRHRIEIERILRV
jgi:nucleolar complex protein 2